MNPISKLIKWIKFKLRVRRMQREDDFVYPCYGFDATQDACKRGAAKMREDEADAAYARSRTQGQENHEREMW